MSRTVEEIKREIAKVQAASATLPGSGTAADTRYARIQELKRELAAAQAPPSQPLAPQDVSDDDVAVALKALFYNGDEGMRAALAADRARVAERAAAVLYAEQARRQASTPPAPAGSASDE